MKEELITEVMQQMLPYLDNAQLKQLRQAMTQALCHYDVAGAQVKPEEDDSNDLITMFIAAKRIEGCSEKTLRYYETSIRRLFASVDCHVTHMQTDDLRTYHREPALPLFEGNPGGKHGVERKTPVPPQL